MFKLLTNTKKVSLLLLLLVLVVVIPKEVLASTESTSWLQEALWGLVNSVFGFFVGFAGLLLNESITTYVVGFGEFYKNTGLGNSINNLWSVIRDIFNLTFIFGLVYIGFRMILDSSDSSAKRTLGTLVIAALLVNFSLFITKFVIDFSNIAAAQLAQAFPAVSISGQATYAVADSFMSLMGLSSIFSSGANESLSLQAAAGTSAGFTYIFGSLILFAVAAFVFAAGGLLLMIRFVVLNIYMVLSPLMFLGFVFPGLSNVSRSYWKGFLSKAFFAPAYILMLYLANQILVNMKGATSSNLRDALDAKTINNDFSSVVPYFIITIAFLVASLVVAQKMGAEGANTAVALGKRASSQARKYTSNAATYVPKKAAGATSGAIGRNTVGRIAASNSLARFNAKINNSTTASIAAGALGLTAKNRQGIIDSAQNAKFGSSQSLNDVKKFDTEQRKRDNEANDTHDRAKAFKEHTKILEDSNTTEKELIDSVKALSNTLKGMTNAEKVDLGIDKLKDIKVAANLKDSDIEGFEKSGNFTSAQIQEIKTARDNAHLEIATKGTTITSGNKNISEEFKANQRKSLLTNSIKDIGKMSTKVFTDSNMAEYFTPQMLEERMKNGGLSSEDLKTIKTNIESKAVEKNQKVWENWSNNSNWGPMLGLEFGTTNADVSEDAASGDSKPRRLVVKRKKLYE